MERGELKDQVRETYAQIAEHFDVTRYMPWPEAVFFSSMLEPGSVVADLGCGNGRNSFCLAEFGMQVLAVDFVPEMLAITERKLAEAGLQSSLRTYCADVVQLPFEDGCADAALYIATLHHLPTEQERTASIIELKRILRPGGLALAGVWAREQERFLEQLANPGQGLSEGDVLVPWTRQADGAIFQRYVHLFGKGELDRLFEGWMVRESFSHADNHYVLAEKR